MRRGAAVLTPQSASGTPPSFTADSPPAGNIGVAYTYPFAASGSPAPTFAVSSGSLPAGLALDSVTGILSGTPTTAGNFRFQITATNGVAPDAVSPTITVTVPGVVQQANVGGADVALSTISATIIASDPANLLVVMFVTGGQVQTGVTDNGAAGGNAYTQKFLESIDAAHCHVGVYMTTVATTKTTTVITGTAAAGDIRGLTVFEIAGATNTAPFDSANGAATTGAPATTGLTGTPAGTNELVLGCCGGLIPFGGAQDFSNPAFTSGAGTVTHVQDSDATRTFSMWAGYLRLSSATAQAFTITTNTGPQGACGSAVALVK